jgi:Spy/CpxP family protein refolding chaperone
MYRTAALLATLALASPALAERGRPPRLELRFDPGRFEEHLDERAERIADLLDLTDDQRRAFDELRSRSFDGVRPKFERMRTLGEELRDLLDGASPEPAAVGAKVIALHELREELGAARDAFESELDKLLTDEQRFAFDALRKARRDFESRGPRDFGHGPGPGFGHDFDEPPPID